MDVNGLNSQLSLRPRKAPSLLPRGKVSNEYFFELLFVIFYVYFFSYLLLSRYLVLNSFIAVEFVLIFLMSLTVPDS